MIHVLMSKSYSQDIPRIFAIFIPFAMSRLGPAATLACNFKPLLSYKIKVSLSRRTCCCHKNGDVLPGCYVVLVVLFIRHSLSMV